MTRLLAVLLLASFATAEDAVTLRALLHEMKDLTRLARFPSPAYTVRQASSYDRKSKTADNFAGWFANGDAGHYLRVEERDGRKEHVMMDEAGPGAVVRIWSANPRGTLRIYLDGALALEEPMGDLLRGKVAPFSKPIAYEAARGCNIYFPFPYEKRCKITSDQGGFYYHVNYRTYPAGTEVEPFQRGKLAGLKNEIDGVIAALARPVDVAGAARDYRLKVGDKPLKIAAAPGGSAFRSLVVTPPNGLAAPLRETVLSIRFDGVETVRVPLGDFFGTGPGSNIYDSLPFQVKRDGALVSRWVMPFREAAELAIEGKGFASVGLTIGLEPHAWDDRSMYFHAKWRSQYGIPTAKQQDWNYVAIEGRGLYVGNLLNIANPVRNWWGEGDEKIYVDGEEFPSHFGTGTEDYYGYAWCCPQPFVHAYHSQTRCDGPGNYGHTSVNRWHIVDAIPFQKSFRFDMEVWHHRRNVSVSYENVNYWYARPGATDNMPRLDPAALKVPEVPAIKVKVIRGAIEAEDLKAVASGGTTQRQDMSSFVGLWSRGLHLWWREAKLGDTLTLEFGAPRAGRYRVVVHLTKSWDYGIHQLHVNGKKAGQPVDLWNGAAIPMKPLDLGAFDLQAKGNELQVKIVGTNPKANPKNFMFGMDCLVLRPAK